MSAIGAGRGLVSSDQTVTRMSWAICLPQGFLTCTGTSICSSTTRACAAPASTANAVVFPDPAAAFVAAHGGDVRCGCRIDALAPLLDDPNFDHVVLAVAPQHAARLLAALPQTPSVRLRMAMLLGQPRTPANLPRAQSLLAGILKSNEANANSLHPLARLLATHYGERQKLEQQNTRLTTQMNELEGRLGDSQRRNDELQRKIDALADIERSLPKPPAGGNGGGAAR